MSTDSVRGGGPAGRSYQLGPRDGAAQETINEVERLRSSALQAVPVLKGEIFAALRTDPYLRLTVRQRKRLTDQLMDPKNQKKTAGALIRAMKSSIRRVGASHTATPQSPAPTSHCHNPYDDTAITTWLGTQGNRHEIQEWLGPVAKWFG